VASLDLAGPHPGAAAPSAPLSEAKRRLLERCREGRLPDAARVRPAIGRRVPGAPIPLSHGQQLLWLHAQLCPELPVYNEPITVHRRGALDVAALERSLREILRRHEAWRTTFPSVDGAPVQVVRPETDMALPLVDLRGLPAHRRDIAEPARQRFPSDIASAVRFAPEVSSFDQHVRGVEPVFTGSAGPHNCAVVADSQHRARRPRQRHSASQFRDQFRFA